MPRRSCQYKEKHSISVKNVPRELVQKLRAECVRRKIVFRIEHTPDETFAPNIQRGGPFTIVRPNRDVLIVEILKAHFNQPPRFKNPRVQAFVERLAKDQNKTVDEVVEQIVGGFMSRC